MAASQGASWIAVSVETSRPPDKEALRRIEQNLALARELGAGETATLEYWTTYQYPAQPLTPQHCQYRRAVMASVENVDIRVQFHPDALPATVWWASWDGVDGPVSSQEVVSLDVQHSAHRYLRSMERTVVGFHWAW